MGGGSNCSASNARVSPGSRTSLCLEFDRLDVVALTTIDGLGPAKIRAHLERIRNDGRPMDDGLASGELSRARARAREYLAVASRIGARCLMDGDPDYPASLL